MTKTEVLAWLKAEQDPRGIKHWEKHAASSGGLKSYGLGLTRLRGYAKQLGRDAKLAKMLWKSKIYDAKVIALLIDDPKTMTVEQAEAQVEELQGGHLAHVFSSCDATLAKAPFVREIAEKWIVSKDKVRMSCGYGLIYEISKSKKKSAPDEAAFLDYIKSIDESYSKQPVWTVMAMGGALMGIGKRSKKLHVAALRVAKKIGPIDFDPDGKCPPFDVAKHLMRKVFS
jgi:3-methyladenine DNA glycosylase AlkD